MRFGTDAVRKALWKTPPKGVGSLPRVRFTPNTPEEGEYTTNPYKHRGDKKRYSILEPPSPEPSAPPRPPPPAALRPAAAATARAGGDADSDWSSDDDEPINIWCHRKS